MLMNCLTRDNAYDPKGLVQPEIFSNPCAFPYWYGITCRHPPWTVCAQNIASWWTTGFRNLLCLPGMKQYHVMRFVCARSPLKLYILWIGDIQLHNKASLSNRGRIFGSPHWDRSLPTAMVAAMIMVRTVLPVWHLNSHGSGVHWVNYHCRTGRLDLGVILNPRRNESTA